MAFEDVQILTVEKHNTGIVIRFDDGVCASYSAALLRETAEKAEPHDETETLW